MTTTTLDTLYRELEYAATPVEYDRLQEEIANTKKQASIARAKQMADANVQLDQALDNHNKNLQKIASAYSEIARIDDRMFKAVSELCEVAIERQEASKKAEELEEQALQAAGFFRERAPHLGVSYHRRTPALVGSPMIRPKLNDFLKVWLQRYLDYRAALGKGNVTLEVIAPHGMQGSTGLEDIISRF